MLGLDEMVGLEVVSSDARAVGTVEGVALDLPNWDVKALVVGLRRGMEDFVGMKRRAFSIERVYIGTDGLEAVSDTVLMRSPAAMMGHMVMRQVDGLTPAGSLMGMRALLSDGSYIGMVDNLSFDPNEGWHVPLVHVKTDRSWAERAAPHPPGAS